MGIYFRDILLIIISRGANNCVQHVFEKNTQLKIKHRFFLQLKIKRISNPESFFTIFTFDHIYQGCQMFGHDCIGYMYSVLVELILLWIEIKW